ncbi:MAG: hypothetical protein HOP09_13365 [Hyphomicrobium sp.]|nr:hypothetical protein [Hyphomicrobium sp.]
MKNRSAIALTVALLFLWAVLVLGLPARGPDSTSAFHRQLSQDFAFIDLRFAENPKHIDLSKLNDGEWIVACASGNLAEHASMKEAARIAGVEVSISELEPVPVLKSGSMFFYIRGDRTAHWFQNSRIGHEIAFGEVVCASPSQPVLKLPTDAALQQLKTHEDKLQR